MALEPPRPEPRTRRFLGGNPASVLMRLVFISILVGVVLSALGLDPFNIIYSIERLFRTIYQMGWDLFSWIWRYFILGAVLVIPIWFLSRLVSRPSSRS